MCLMYLPTRCIFVALHSGVSNILNHLHFLNKDGSCSELVNVKDHLECVVSSVKCNSCTYLVPYQILKGNLQVALCHLV
jgi:hypothetical protein